MWLGHSCPSPLTSYSCTCGSNTGDFGRKPALFCRSSERSRGGSQMDTAFSLIRSLSSSAEETGIGFRSRKPALLSPKPRAKPRGTEREAGESRTGTLCSSSLSRDMPIGSNNLTAADQFLFLTGIGRDLLRFFRFSACTHRLPSTKLMEP